MSTPGAVPAVSAVLFARDHARVAKFYRHALGLACANSAADHSVLSCDGFELVVHAVAESESDEPGQPRPAVRRERGPIRLNFPVESLERARAEAAKLGGQIDDSPPVWAPADAAFRLGHDPEGNVLMIYERPR